VTNDLGPTRTRKPEKWTQFVRPVTTVIYVTESAIVTKKRRTRRRARPTKVPSYIVPTPKPVFGYGNTSRSPRPTNAYRNTNYIKPTPRPVISSGANSVARANLAPSLALTDLPSRVTSLAQAIPDVALKPTQTASANVIASRSSKDFSPSKVVQALALGLALMVIL
jgi:hypothetical protein